MSQLGKKRAGNWPPGKAKPPKAGKAGKPTAVGGPQPDPGAHFKAPPGGRSPKHSRGYPWIKNKVRGDY